MKGLLNNLLPFFSSLPGEKERLEILDIHRRKLGPGSELDSGVDLSWVATFCVGFSGADLAALLHNAQMEAFDEARRGVDEVEHAEASSKVDPLIIDAKHMDKALISTKPSITQGEAQKYDRVYEDFLKGKSKIRRDESKDAVQTIFVRSQRQTFA